MSTLQRECFSDHGDHVGKISLMRIANKNVGFSTGRDWNIIFKRNSYESVNIFNQPTYPSLKRPTCVATLKSCDTT